MIKKLDYSLILIVIFLIIFGIVILASVSFSISQEKFGNTFYFLNHQIFLGLIPGIILAWLLYRTPAVRLRKYLKKLALPLLSANLVLLGLVFLPAIGLTIKGATRWISLGPISFQPSEFLKLTFILYLASWLSIRTSPPKEKPFRLKKKLLAGFQASHHQNITLIAFFSVLGIISLLLILQPDISTLGTIAIIALIMYFLAGAPFWHILLIVSTGIIALLGLIKIAPYRMDRFLIFLKPELSPQGIGYHLQQSLIAIGSGGIKGLGLGLSRQRLGFLPRTMSDSVFSILAEEMGFIGALSLIILFLAFLIVGFKISSSTKDRFLQLTGFGITSWIVIQAFINIGAMIGIVPLTGIPLPFVSYGGSAIMVELIGVGILLNISKQSKIL